MIRIWRAEDGDVFQVRSTLDTCTVAVSTLTGFNLQTTATTTDIVRYTTKGYPMVDPELDYQLGKLRDVYP